MTCKIVAYAGTYRIKDDLRARGFVYDPADGGAWVKYHANESQVWAYKTLQRGAWSGIVFTATEEKVDPIAYDPNQHIEQGEE